MTACGAIGALTVGGRVVGQLRCELYAGHDVDRTYCEYFIAATPHRVTLTWTPEETPDLDLFDPDETFDVDVPLSPSAPEDVPSVEPVLCGCGTCDSCLRRESWADLFRRFAGPKRAPMYGSSDDDGI